MKRALFVIALTLVVMFVVGQVVRAIDNDSTEVTWQTSP